MGVALGSGVLVGAGVGEGLLSASAVNCWCRASTAAASAVAGSAVGVAWGPNEQPTNELLRITTMIQRLPVEKCQRLIVVPHHLIAKLACIIP